jgi:hypothetical protein
MRTHPPAISYVARKTGEGKSKRDAMRCLKRHLISTIYRTITPSPEAVPEPFLT